MAHVKLHQKRFKTHTFDKVSAFKLQTKVASGVYGKYH